MYLVHMRKEKRKEDWSIRLFLKQLITFLLTVDNQLRFPSNNGLNALSVYKRNDFFAKLLRSLEEKEETFQEEANASRQFIISCAFTYHKLHFRLKSCHFESEDYFLTGTRKQNKKREHICK